jgi:hypothetical protein
MHRSSFFTLLAAGGAAAWPQVTLPQNLLLTAGTLKEDFENSADWTPTNGTVANDATNHHSGSQSVKLSCTAGLDASMLKTVNWDLSGAGRIVLWIYLDNMAVADWSAIKVYLFTNTGLSTGFWFNLLSSSTQFITPESAWHRIVIPKSSMALVGAGNWANPIVRVRIHLVAQSTKTPSMSFDQLEFGETAVPAIVLWDDDGNIESYNNIYSYMHPKALRGTISIDSHNIDFDGTYLSTAQVVEMAAGGWTMANHTNSGNILNGQSEANQEAAIQACITYLTNLGLTKGVKHLAYPSGTFDTNTYTAMSNLGMLTGRVASGVPAKLASNGNQLFSLPWNDLRQIIVAPTTSSTALADIETGIDNAILGGLVYPFLFHRVGNTGQMTTANFQLLIDYIYPKVVAGQIYCITVDELYKLTLGSVQIPVVK